MIVCAARKVEIGSQHKGVWVNFKGHEEGHPEQPVVVLREATREEYEAYVREAADNSGLPVWAPEGAFYYEISVD